MTESDALAILASDADTHAKAMACDLLGRAGSAKAVPALAKLLADEKLNDYARDGLERIPDPAAGEALLGALQTLKGNLLVGVVITLGDRGDGSAVPALAGIAKGGDEVAADAALASLGQIATDEAVAVILRAMGKAETRIPAAHAALAAAERLDGAGRKDAAAKLRGAVAGAELPAHLVGAAKSAP